MINKNLRSDNQKAFISKETNTSSIHKMVPFSAKVNNDNECYLLFNPKDKEGYDFLTENWSNALVGLLNNVYSKRNLQPRKIF